MFNPLMELACCLNPETGCTISDLAADCTMSEKEARSLLEDHMSGANVLGICKKSENSYYIARAMWRDTKAECEKYWNNRKER